MTGPEKMSSTAADFQPVHQALQMLGKPLRYPTIAGEVLTTANRAAVLYIGLGDQFDDDRRLVPEPAPALRQAIRVAGRPTDLRQRLLDCSYLKAFALRGT